LKKQTSQTQIKRGFIAKLWLLDIQRGQTVNLPARTGGEPIIVATDQELYKNMAEYEEITVEAFQDLIKRAVMLYILLDMFKKDKAARSCHTIVARMLQTVDSRDPGEATHSLA
jgi:hypothetical protein